MIRRSALALVFVVAVATLAAGSAQARRPAAGKGRRATPAGPLVRGSRYLALGDSVTFGYQEATTTPPPVYSKPATFLGYPEQIAAQVHVKVTNLACPGETSASFIDVTAPSFGCENAYRKSFPLHVRYRGSQLSAATRFLRRHRGVRLVSLMIGANDLFRCQQTTADACLSPAEQRPVLARIGRNVRRILSTIRRRAHYAGQIAILDYYSLDYSSTLISQQSQKLDHALNAAARPYHVVYASGYRAFRRGSVKFGGQPCLAGLRTQLNSTVGSCGVHPSYAGQALLAAAVLGAIRL